MTDLAAERPHGRDEVRRAVLAAAGSLVAERGPDGFSVREVAARAGVNHALVHRHFGTKAGVLEEVLAEEARAVVAAIGSAGLPTSGTPPVEVVAALLDLLADRPSYWRTLVHAVLQAPEAAVPGTASTTELFSGLWQGGDEERASATAVSGLTVLGWLLFRDFMADATGGDPEEIRRLVAEQVAGIPEQPPAGQDS